MFNLYYNLKFQIREFNMTRSIPLALTEGSYILEYYTLYFDKLIPIYQITRLVFC